MTKPDIEGFLPMKTIFFLLSFVIPFALLQAKELARWSVLPGPKFQIKNFDSVSRWGHVMKLLSSEEQTPEGEPVFKVVIEKTIPNPIIWQKQLNFIYSKPLVQGMRYRLSFFLRTNAKCDFSCTVAEGYSPYRNLVSKKITADKNWQKINWEFVVPARVGDPPFAVPRIFLGGLPEGTVLEFGPVVLEEISKEIPFALSPTWRMADEKSGRVSITRIPAKTVEVTQQGDRLDLSKLAELNGSVVLYQTVTVPEDSVMQLGMAADWWFSCFVNGTQVYSTMKGGNIDHTFKPEDHIFNLPLKKGKNLIAVRVKSGSKGFLFVCGKVAKFTGDPRMAKLFKPVHGEEFRSVDGDRFLFIKKGTALDLSSMVSSAGTIEETGWIRIGKNGKAVYEKKPEIPVRLFGFVWVISDMWRQETHKWTPEQIELFADQVALRGYNTVRIHLPEGFFQGFKYAINFYKKRTIRREDIPQTLDEMKKHLDLAQVDRFDRITAALKKRNIRYTMDICNKNMITGTSKGGYAGTFKSELFHDPLYRSHWKLCFDTLMNHVNPYTKVAYKDEPAFFMVDFTNEQDLRIAQGLGFLTPSYRKWLKEKYRTDTALSESWQIPMKFDDVPNLTEKDLRGTSRRSADAVDFLIFKMKEMTDFYYQVLKESGYKGLFTLWDMNMRNMEMPARSKVSAITQHTYFAHPFPAPKELCPFPKSRSNAFVGNMKGNMSARQTSSFQSSYYRAAAAVRFWDRPYFMTEYSHCSPNRFRHERGLYFSGYAALQGWDGIYVHNAVPRLNTDPFLQFETSLDPVTRANEFLAALIYRRSDVKKSPHQVELKLDPEKLFPAHALAGVSDDYARIAMVTGLGMSFPGKPLVPVGKESPDLTIEPSQFSYLSVSAMNVEASNKAGPMVKSLFEQLREKKILSENNPSDPEKEHYVSDTGELELNVPQESFKVITPRLEGVSLKKNQPTKLNLLTLNSISRPAAVSLASLDGKKTLKDSDRLLLVVSTNAFNTGEIFNNRNQTLCFESGNYPALIEAVKFDLSFANGRKQIPTLYALHFSGERAEKIPVTVENGQLRISCDTSKLRYGTMFFELVY